MTLYFNKSKFPCKNNPKCDPKNWWNYIVGKLRNFAFYSDRYGWLIRKHIREQINWRIDSMDSECKVKGACKICGCETPSLQMANKACPKPCYPKMMSKSEWGIYKQNYKLNY